jgi:hypothetical protein
MTTTQSRPSIQRKKTMNNAYQQNFVPTATARPKQPLSALLCAAALGL